MRKVMKLKDKQCFGRCDIGDRADEDRDENESA